MFGNIKEMLSRAINGKVIDPYPKTVAEVLDDKIKYRKGLEEIVLKFKKSHPWKGSLKKVEEKFHVFNEELAGLYKIETPKLVFVKKFACGCCYFPVGNVIIMEQEKDGRYSVVTFLHEFGHALGKNEKNTCRWSINLFRKYFPESYDKLHPHGHLLYLPKA